MAPRPKIVEWYRVDETPRIVGAALKGGLLITVGCFSIGAALSSMVSDDGTVRALAGAFGAVCIISGPILAITAFQKILSQEVYLALRNDGLYVQLVGRKELIAWDDVEEARTDEAGAIVIRRKGSEPLVITQQFASISPRDVCERIHAIRRKAQWNLLPGMR